MWKWCKSIVDVAFFFLHFWQLGCYNSFFFPPIFNNLVATIHIFLSPRPYNFGNLVATIVLFRPPSLGRTRISIISLSKFNFLSPLTHCTFSCNFNNTITEIQFFSSFYQITLNSTYDTDKLHFLSCLAKKTLKWVHVR